jgi:uracil-xanthine permease
LFVVGLLLFMAGLIIHFAGARVIHRALPPVVTGAVVMLIGFNLAPVVASVYWPVDPWLAFLVMLIVVGLSIGLRGFWGRIAIFLSLVVGYVLSWAADVVMGPLQTADGARPRVDWSNVAAADWIGFPPLTDLANWTYGATDNVVGFHLPQFSLGAIIVAMPVVIALIAENTGHVKAVAEMTKDDLDPLMGRAIAADGAGSMVATLVGAGPTTTYAENIGVMAASRVYSTAAYVVAAVVAILFGFSPKFGAVISATPSAVLGGITVVLYGMIGLLGAKIWKENNVDFGNPLNLIPASAGIIIGIGNVSVPLGGDFELGGIALGTIVTIGVYHLARIIAPRTMREQADGASIIYDAPGIYTDEDATPRL